MHSCLSKGIGKLQYICPKYYRKCNNHQLRHDTWIHPWNYCARDTTQLKNEYDKQAWEYNEKKWQHNHYNKQPNNTPLTQIRHQGNLTWNGARQTIYGESQPSCRMKNDKQAWEYNVKHTWQHNHYNKQPNNTRLTQTRHHGNLTWNRARQTIYGEFQVSWRMKNDKQAWEYNEKHMTTQSLQQATKQYSTHTNSTSRQCDLESCHSNHCRRDPTKL
jgi:hypothetical protein